jgi:hypothetical protein
LVDLLDFGLESGTSTSDIMLIHIARRGASLLHCLVFSGSVLAAVGDSPCTSFASQTTASPYLLSTTLSLDYLSYGAL